MKNSGWFFLLGLFLSTVGCTTLTASNFDNIFETNPNTGPQELSVALKAHPVEDTQINSSFEYQVYNLNWLGTRKEAVYFKNGQMIGKDPTYTDKFSNLNTLLQLGAITQQQHDDPCGTHVPGFVDAGCGCGQPGPSGCDNECGSTKENDACGVCGGSVSSCSLPYTCMGDTCGCAGPTDCNGTCDGSATVDSCGVCGGNGSECAPPPSI